MNGQYFEILIFAVFAALIIYRLRSVLGRRTGQERPPPDQLAARRERTPDNRERESASDNIVHLPDADAPPGADAAGDGDETPARTPLEAGLNAIKALDRNFGTEEFLDGSRGAFEMIVAAYAEGDLAKLKSLLSKEVYENFADAVQSRYDSRETLVTTLVSIKSVSLIDARVEGRTAIVTIKFVSEQINVTRDPDGKVVDGDPDNVTDITDIWTFARDARSRDPNWTLVETSSSN